MSTLSTSRMNCPSHNGTAQLIRDALAQAGEPMSVYRLFLATGKTTKQIKHAIGQMVVHGGIVSSPGPKGVVYSLYRSPKQKQAPNPGGEFRIAGPITIPQYRYGSSRLE